ncbi:MAG: recombinase family protein [Desulforudis sp.]|nr:MAG: recombinase family protein [Desulforudis sp.]
MEESKRCKRVGIWVRVSTEDQARGESPEHHEQRARYYAQSKNWKVVEHYNLSGVSGKSVLEHPEAKRMIADIQSGHISGLIFSKLARIARNTRELLDIADIFRSSEAGLISLQEAIDTTTPAGRLFYTMIAAMAQWEREEISERVAASVPIRAQLGKPLGGAAPFGYQWEGKSLIVNPDESPIRKLMFELFLEHKRKKTVARLLNQRGFRTRSGSEFSDTTVERLLTDPIAKGLRRANYTKSTGDNKHWKFKPEDQWVYSSIEPIVSEELWEKCNAILAAQKESGKRIARKTATHLFAGLTFCHCGGKMYVPSNSKKYTCLKCRNKIPAEDLEAIYQEQLKDFLISEENLATYIHQADDAIQEKTQQLEVLKKEKTDLAREMDKLYDLYMDGQISKEGFGRKHKPLEERFTQLENQLPKLQSEIDFLKIQNLSSEQILSETRDLHSRWSILSRDEQSQIVETITESIIIHKDEVAVNLHYLPFFLNDDNRATNGQGFIAATSMKRAGKRRLVAAREMVTTPSSRGWRITSRTFLRNSGSSSRKSTPLWARDTSPGLGMWPPPIRPASEMVWCGERKGRITRRGVSLGSMPAVE